MTLWWQIHNIAWVQDWGMGECLFWHMFNPPDSYQSIGTIIPQGETTSQWSKWLIRLHLMTNQFVLQHLAFWLQIALRDLHQRVGHRRHRHGRRVGDPSIAWSGDVGQDKYDRTPKTWDPRWFYNLLSQWQFHACLSWNFMRIHINSGWVWGFGKVWIVPFEEWKVPKNYHPSVRNEKHARDII